MKVLGFSFVALLLLYGWAEDASGNGEETHVLDTSEEGMKRIARSLGVECTHCHVAEKPDGRPDFESPSPFKETARHMKIHFVDSLKTVSGEPLTCATCHQGKARFLPRDLKGAKRSGLSEFMPRREIVTLMKGISKSLGVKCSYCHVKGEDGRLDPARPTEHKLIAKYMMDHFTSGLVGRDGSEVTCFSCHQGKGHFLPRSEAQGE